MKKFLSVLLTVVMVMCAFSSMALAVSELESQMNSSTVDGTFTSIAGKILKFIQYAGYAVALGMIIYIGIKYMLAGAGQKAEVKSTFLPYLIGAVCVGAAATIANFFLGLAQ